MVKVPELKLTAPDNQPVEIIDLEHHHCRFIVGSSVSYPGLALYCGARKEFGSYCEYHAHQCYNIEYTSRRASN